MQISKSLSAIIVGLLNLTACDPFTDQVRDVKPNSVSELTLRRTLKQIKRYTCDGELRSDKIEEIGRANALINVHPNANTSRIFHSTFSNRSTGDRGGATSGLTGLYIDIAESSMAMHVAVGANIVDYKFTECLNLVSDSLTQQTSCLDEQLLEEGSIQLNITFVEETMPGFEEYRETCPAPKPAMTP